MSPTAALPGSMTRTATRLSSGSRCPQSPKRLSLSGGPHALAIRSFLSRGLDRVCSLLAGQGGEHSNHPASGASSLAYLPRSHFGDRDGFAHCTSHPAAPALRPALAVWVLALLDGSRPHHRRPSFRRLGARAPRP